jgi:L-asparaginase
MQVNARKIVVLGTGGTIAGTADDPNDHVGYRAGALDVQTLLARLPAVDRTLLVSEQVAQVDSKDMDFAVWQRLARRSAQWLSQPDVVGLVITHGTDTLEETAFFLHSVLPPGKPVVLTCAMRPATALSPDGPQNLADALTVAGTPGAHGVMAVCAGAVHAAVDVSKVHPLRLDAFSSGDAGPVGHVEGGALRLHRPWPQGGADWARLAARIERSSDAWPRVQIVMNHAGADGSIVRALLAHGVDGIVAAGTGNGTLSEPLQLALLEARAAGVSVLRATRCAAGAVLPHQAQALPAAPGLSPVKARVAMLLDLLA